MLSRWGRIYASTFTGSLVGAGAPVFAVWSYALANGAAGRVDLHPALIAAQIGITREEAEKAIAYLCSPDASSRSAEKDGRRLVHVSGVVHEIVNYWSYNPTTSALTEYNREKQRESRARRGLSNQVSMKSIESIDIIEENTREENTRERPASADVTKVFDAWREIHRHPNARLDQKRKTRIAGLLKTFTADQLEQALRGAKLDDWLMCRDPKSPRKYDGVENILRDVAQVERLIELHQRGTSKPQPVKPKIPGWD